VPDDDEVGISAPPTAGRIKKKLVWDTSEQRIKHAFSNLVLRYPGKVRTDKTIPAALQDISNKNEDFGRSKCTESLSYAVWQNT
jgi:hypothetical protein